MPSSQSHQHVRGPCLSCQGNGKDNSICCRVTKDPWETNALGEACDCFMEHLSLRVSFVSHPVSNGSRNRQPGGFHGFPLSLNSHSCLSYMSPGTQFMSKVLNCRSHGRFHWLSCVSPSVGHLKPSVHQWAANGGLREAEICRWHWTQMLGMLCLPFAVLSKQRDTRIM